MAIVGKTCQQIVHGGNGRQPVGFLHRRKKVHQLALFGGRVCGEEFSLSSGFGIWAAAARGIRPDGVSQRELRVFRSRRLRGPNGIIEQVIFVLIDCGFHQLLSFCGFRCNRKCKNLSDDWCGHSRCRSGSLYFVVGDACGLLRVSPCGRREKCGKQQKQRFQR